MGFLWKNKQLGWRFLDLERGIQLQTLIERDSVILFAMDHQRWGLKLFYKIAGRPALVHFRVFPWHTLELPHREPQLLSRSGHAAQIENSVVGNHSFEAAGVAEE